MRYSKYLLLLMVFTLLGCTDPWSGYTFITGVLPDSPVNLDAFNTIYDDYNSATIFQGSLSPFCFSTNRHSKGGEFNIRYEPMKVTWDKVKGELKVYNGYSRRATYT